MPEYVVVFEQEFEPRRGASLIEAETPQDARKIIEDSVPPGMGTSIRVESVNATDAEAPAEKPTGPVLVIVPNPA